MSTPSTAIYERHGWILASTDEGNVALERHVHPRIELELDPDTAGYLAELIADVGAEDFARALWRASITAAGIALARRATPLAADLAAEFSITTAELADRLESATRVGPFPDPVALHEPERAAHPAGHNTAALDKLEHDLADLKRDVLRHGVEVDRLAADADKIIARPTILERIIRAIDTLERGVLTILFGARWKS